MERYLRTFSVAIVISAKRYVNSLGRIAQIKMCCPSEAACANGANVALVTASPGHVEFINDATSFDVRHPHVKSEKRAPSAEIPEKETRQRAPAIDAIKSAFDQPSQSGRFGVFKNSRRSDSFQFFLQVLREFNRSKRLPNWHFAI